MVAHSVVVLLYLFSLIWAAVPSLHTALLFSTEVANAWMRRLYLANYKAQVRLVWWIVCFVCDGVVV